MNNPAHHSDAHGSASNDSITTEPWLARWWSLLVIGYILVLVLFLVAITNETFGR